MAAVLVEEHAPAAVATARSSIITLVNSSIGAGILALPYAFSLTGWAAGLVAIVVVATVEAFTLYVLSRWAEASGARTYGDMVRRQLGREASLAICLITFLFLWGSLIGYLVVVGDSFHPLVAAVFGWDKWWTSRCGVMTAVGVCCILPLTFKRSLGALAAVSSTAVACILIVVGTIVFRSVSIAASPGHSWEGLQAFNRSLGFFGALPLIILGFACHTNVISVFSELEQRPLVFPSSASLAAALARDRLREEQEAAAAAGEAAAAAAGAAAAGAAGAGGAGGAGDAPPSPEALLRRSSMLSAGSSVRRRRVKSSKLVGMVQVVAVSSLLTSALYAATGLCGYLAFLGATRSDVLLNFARDDVLMQVARAAVGLVLCASYPVIHFPARVALKDLLQHASGRQLGAAGDAWFHALEPLAFFFSTLGVGLWCTDLGSVFSFMGGTCGSILVLSVPGALLIQYAHSKHREARELASSSAAAAGGLSEPLLSPEHGAASAAAAENGTAAANGHGGGNGHAAEAAASEAAGWPAPYSLWQSKLFWSGVALQLLAAAMFAYTVATAVHPLKPN